MRNPVNLATASIWTALLLAIGPTPSIAQTPELLVDLGEQSAIWDLDDIGGTLFFSGGEQSTGIELWVSDGTPGGTHLVADIYPGDSGSHPAHLADLGGVCLFRAWGIDSSVGEELWRSDGTAAGTWMVRDLNPNGHSAPSYLYTWNGAVYFTAISGPYGQEIHKSDGTEAGTVVVHDTWPGSGSGGAEHFQAAGGILYFESSDDTHGKELWRTDGTDAGTWMVKDINPSGHSLPNELIEFNSMLFFVANDYDYGAGGRELWKSDGTEAGTVMVMDIYPGANSSPAALCVFNGELYFGADDGVHGQELWKSDGTEAGTVLVKDINSYGDAIVNGLTVVGAELFFAAKNSWSYDMELWKTDGTEAGTVRVKDIQPGLSGSSPDWITDYNGLAYFHADDGTHGKELWKSDGTEAGTVLVDDFNPGSESSIVSDEIRVAGGKLYFALRTRNLSNNIVHQLWMIDDGGVSAPQNFAVHYTGSGNQLNWSSGGTKQYTHYRVYRDEDPEFVPEPGNLVHTTVDTEWFDSAGAYGHHYKLTAADDQGGESDPLSPTTMTGVGTENGPVRFWLGPNTPNPFNPFTTIRYELPTAARVNLRVFDLGGRLVRVLRNQELESRGTHEALWDGRDLSGRDVGAGVYIYQLDAGRFSETRRMTLVK